MGVGRAARLSSLVLLLLVVLAPNVQRVSAAKLDNSGGFVEPEEGPEELGFLTTTISSLSNLLGLGKTADKDDPPRLNSQEDEDNNNAFNDDDDDDEWNEASPKMEGNDLLRAELQLQPNQPPVLQGFVDGVMADAPVEENDEDNNNNNDNDEDDDDKDEKNENEDSEEEEEEEGEAPPKPDTRSALEKKLDEIAMKEDAILRELGRNEADRSSSSDPTGLLMVNKLKPGGGSDRGGGGGGGYYPLVPRNASGGMMADRIYRQPLPLSYTSSSPLMSSVSRRMEGCNDCLVNIESPRCPMDDPAKDLKHWIGELVEILSYGCPNSCSDDGSMRCCYRRDPDIMNAMTELTDLAKQMHRLFESSCTKCPRGWGDWCEWGACSTSCATGTRTRSRQCHDPSGSSCQGLRVETTPCSNPECCTDGSWSPWMPWSPCSASCGNGLQERARVCSNPAPNHCGRTCPGPNADTKPCDTGRSCCTDGNWSHWSLWSQCPVTCGSAMVARTRTCSSPPPNYCGRTCPGSGQDSKMCDTYRRCCTPQNGNWSPWQMWSSCSASCGSGSRERQRTCSNPSPNECGQQCFGLARDTDMCMSRDCCVSGSWGRWATWSQCSASCGMGRRERRRQCDSPAPNHCGRSCPGSGMDNDDCYTQITCEPDCVHGDWGMWQSWSRCSATCGSGMKTRMRRCDSPSPNFCGRRCSGSASDTTPCQNLRDCCEPQDGNWSPWSYWTTCSATCGGGTRDRTRTCSNPAPNRCGRSCPGPTRDSDRCQQGPCCQDGNWGLWGPWETPTRSCGMAIRERHRRCDNPPADYCGRTCPGLNMERDQYDTNIPCHPDCIHGNWAPWAPWSPCSVSCGRGSRDRYRHCTNPAPNLCGRPCPDHEGRDSEACFVDPQNGNWATWASWSSCSVTCGTGSIERTRTCSNPPPNPCGVSCQGPSRDTDYCRLQSCCIPQHGNWSPWSRWSSCPVTCGAGRIERTRTCSNPPPNECGSSCHGSSRDADSCDEGPCCADRSWELWGQWSQPGVTCGTASRERRRRCARPSWGMPDCGRSCPGPDYERESFDTGIPCKVCIDGNWSSWSFWSACDKTCGEGMQERERLCSNPPPNRCGISCMGPAKDMRRCNEGPCCIPQNGNWGSWNRWSQCSATCGSGTRDRRRECNNPSANRCGRRCPGPDMDTQICEGPQNCCVNGNWGNWGAWSQPSVSCGEYVTERRRRCDNPRPNYCGRNCVGSPVKTLREDTRIPCEPPCEDSNWGQWESWSPCPATCGMAERTRRRRCDNPSPDRCRQRCPGSDYDTALQRCGPDMGNGNWAQWGMWGGCSRTCGGGTQSRRRRCDGGPCQSRCPGYDSDSQPCNERACCVTSWGSWSSCSATCQGFGVRERRQVAVGCFDDFIANQRETEPCQIFSPPCSVPADWTPWNNWCPCECKSGSRARRRTCMQTGSRVDISNCPGAARQQEYCDTKLACPVCIDQCQNRLDGEYPACTSCADYISCSNGRSSMLSCAANGFQYDGFIQKCVSPPSPSCTLVDCITTCSGMTNGKYPSCSGCGFYIQCTNGRDGQLSCPSGQEFNAHSEKCVHGRSPTCKRAIRNTLDFMVRDAPADSYFPSEDEISKDDREALYMELRKQTGIAAKFNRSGEDVFGEIEARRRDTDMEERRAKKEEEWLAGKEKDLEAFAELLEEEEDSLERGFEEDEDEEWLEEKERKIEGIEELLEEEEDEMERGFEEEEEEEELGGNPGDDDDIEKPQIKDIRMRMSGGRFLCWDDCEEVPKGRYQSCHGCQYFMVCTKYGRARHVKCPRYKQWDNVLKVCVRDSSTCNEDRTNDTQP